MTYKKRIISWHTKAMEYVGDYFIQYSIEYLAFLCYIKILKFDNIEFDRAAIQNLKQNSAIKMKYLDKINNNEELKNNWNKVIRELDREPLRNLDGYNENIIELKWWDCSDGNNPRNKDYNPPTSENGKIHSMNDWINMVEFWYSVRCNLFHGAKALEKKRDKFLVKYAYKTLKELLDIFINNINSESNSIEV